jgi:hypothetical protein
LGEWPPKNAGQVRRRLSLPKEHRPDCWNGILAKAAPSALTAREVGDKIRHYSESRELPGFGSGKKGGEQVAAGAKHLSKLRKITAGHTNCARISALVDEIEELLG